MKVDGFSGGMVEAQDMLELNTNNTTSTSIPTRSSSSSCGCRCIIVRVACIHRNHLLDVEVAGDKMENRKGETQSVVVVEQRNKH